MIFGNCPYCDEHFTSPSPDKTPMMGKITCESCGKWFWEYYSRIEPRSYLPDEVEVDEKNKSVKLIGDK